MRSKNFSDLFFLAFFFTQRWCKTKIDVFSPSSNFPSWIWFFGFWLNLNAICFASRNVTSRTALDTLQAVAKSNESITFLYSCPPTHIHTHVAHSKLILKIPRPDKLCKTMYFSHMHTRTYIHASWNVTYGKTFWTSQVSTSFMKLSLILLSTAANASVNTGVKFCIYIRMYVCIYILCVCIYIYIYI